MEVVVSSASNTHADVIVRTETFVNQFRCVVTDEIGRKQDWTVHKGKPVWYSNDEWLGFTTVKDISVAGFFTAPGMQIVN